MSRGKYLSLEEARQKDKQGNDSIEQFYLEHPSTGDRQVFDMLIDTMAKSLPVTEGTSGQEHDED